MRSIAPVSRERPRPYAPAEPGRRRDRRRNANNLKPAHAGGTSELIGKASEPTPEHNLRVDGIGASQRSVSANNLNPAPRQSGEPLLTFRGDARAQAKLPQERQEMALSRTRAIDYAERLINRPRGETPVAIRRNKRGYTLLHQGRALTKTHASGVGELQAQAMALALGIDLPDQVGDQTTARVGSGVLYRAIAASSLDLRRPEARIVLEQLLSTAALQRGVFRTLEIG